MELWEVEDVMGYLDARHERQQADAPRLPAEQEEANRLEYEALR